MVAFNADISALILAPDESSFFKNLKYLEQVRGYTIISSVVDKGFGVVPSVTIVTNSEDSMNLMKDSLSPLPGEDLYFLSSGDSCNLYDLFLYGISQCTTRHTLVMLGDSPLIPDLVLQTLVDLGVKRDAALLRDIKGEPYPFLGVYNTAATKKALEKSKNIDFIDKLNRVLFISYRALQTIDPDLLSFFRVITPLDLRRMNFFLSGGHIGKRGKGHRHKAGKIHI